MKRRIWRFGEQKVWKEIYKKLKRSRKRKEISYILKLETEEKIFFPTLKI